MWRDKKIKIKALKEQDVPVIFIPTSVGTPKEAILVTMLAHPDLLE
jgi:hypothetical protein